MPMQRIFSGASSGGNSSTSAKRHVGAHAVGGGFGLVQRLRAEHVEQGGEAAQPRAQIDDALADDRAKARPAAHIIACKAHIAVSLQAAGGRPFAFQRCVRSIAANRQRP